MQSFFPRMVREAPGTRVFPGQGSVLHVRLNGSSTLAVVHERDGSHGATRLHRLIQSSFQAVLSVIERFGGDILKLSFEEIIAFFPDGMEARGGVLPAIAAASEIQIILRDGHLFRGVSGSVGYVSSMGVACGVMHGVLLGNAEWGQQVVLTGPALEDAKRASKQVGAGEIALHPSAGVRLSVSEAETQPQLPTPAVTRLLALKLDVPDEPLMPLEEDGGGSLYLPPILSSVVAEGGPPPMFLRLITVTSAVSGLDPLRGTGLEPLLAWYEKAQELVHKLGGHIVDAHVGEICRLTIIFGAPFSHVDDETRGLQCALGLQRIARDQLEITDGCQGVATGTGFVSAVGLPGRKQYAACGLRMELSGRLADYAGPWEILVDRHTVSRAGFGFDWGPSPSTPTADDAELITARLLYGEGAHGTKLTSRARGSLVGREELMDTLREVADEAIAGRGTVVSLVGEAGIGKSAMLIWLGQHLQEERSIPVYRGECNALIRNAPYYAWMAVFKDWFDFQSHLKPKDLVGRIRQRVESLGQDLLPRLPLLSMVTGLTIPDTAATGGLDARKRREALYGYVLELFRRAHGKVPMGLIFEDVHWMDAASLELLRFVGRNVGDIPLFITCTRRPEESQPELVAQLEALKNTRVFQIGRLGEDALRRLACRHLGARALASKLDTLLIQRCEGSPLYLEEMTLYLRDTDQVRVNLGGEAEVQPKGPNSIPLSIREVIEGRVAQLDEGAQLTLKAASVVGRTFTLSLLQEVYPVPFETNILNARLERMEGLDIVRREHSTSEVWARGGSRKGGSSGLNPQGMFFFKHALICDTVYRSLTSANRRSMHEAVGLALEKRLSSDNRSELVLTIAEHFRRTMRTDKQRIYFREAGEIASARALFKEACDYYRSAEDLSQLVGDRDGVAELLNSQNIMLNLLGERDRQKEVIARWKEVVQESQDERRFADALIAEGSLLGRIGRPQDGVSILKQAREISQGRQDVLQEARVLRVLCRNFFQQGEHRRALDAAQTAFNLAKDKASWKESAFDECNIGMLLGSLDQAAEGRLRMEKALEAAQEHNDLVVVSGVLGNLAHLEIGRGCLDKALDNLERALGIARQLGDRTDELSALSNLGYVQLLSGALEESAQNCRRAIALARVVDDIWVEAHATVNLGLKQLWSGGLEEARDTLERGRMLADEAGDRAAKAESIEYLARIELLEGRAEACAALLESAAELDDGSHPSMKALKALCLSRRGLQAHAETEAQGVMDALAASSGMEVNRHLVYFTISQVFESSNSEKAFECLTRSRDTLLERVACIEDMDIRERMLTRIQDNHVILESWKNSASVHSS